MFVHIETRLLISDEVIQKHTLKSTICPFWRLFAVMLSANTLAFTVLTDCSCRILLHGRLVKFPQNIKKYDGILLQVTWVKCVYNQEK